MKINIYYLTKDELGSLIDWHAKLEDRRGDRAQLRRASNPIEVVSSPAFHRFLSFMKTENPSYHSADKFPENKLMLLAIIVGLVARLEPKNKALFAKTLGGGDRTYSEARFQQLLQSRDEDEFFRRMSLAIHFLKRKVSVEDMCDCICKWYKEYKVPSKTHLSDQFKFQMTVNYYQLSSD
ncbi:type I-E CRISPR-associated protein Cse2/CasB [Sessilibacter corallicola]|uniref:Type I-E CRISPR-associated protein Cse2/CasB n=1 Tax=Sessilibacter corallicola TaxID=2904075 RepID=A0ABQ0ACW4_9GAMM